MLKDRCEFGKEDYSLNIINLPKDISDNLADDTDFLIPNITETKNKKAKAENQGSLF